MGSQRGRVRSLNPERKPVQHCFRDPGKSAYDWSDYTPDRATSEASKIWVSQAMAPSQSRRTVTIHLKFSETIRQCIRRD